MKEYFIRWRSDTCIKTRNFRADNPQQAIIECKRWDSRFVEVLEIKEK